MSLLAGCGGRINADEDGEIVSPGWPGVYERNRNCIWIIQPRESGLYMLTIKWNWYGASHSVEIENLSQRRFENY